MHFFARLGIDLQISILGFSHELLVFSIFHQENVKSESHTVCGIPSYSTNWFSAKIAIFWLRDDQNFFLNCVANQKMVVKGTQNDKNCQFKGVCDSDLTYSRWNILKTKSSWEKPKMLICRSFFNLAKKCITN